MFTLIGKLAPIPQLEMIELNFKYNMNQRNSKMAPRSLKWRDRHDIVT